MVQHVKGANQLLLRRDDTQTKTPWVVKLNHPNSSAALSLETWEEDMHKKSIFKNTIKCIVWSITVCVAFSPVLVVSQCPNNKNHLSPFWPALCLLVQTLSWSQFDYTARRGEPGAENYTDCTWGTTGSQKEFGTLKYYSYTHSLWAEVSLPHIVLMLVSY